MPPMQPNRITLAGLIDSTSLARMVVSSVCPKNVPFVRTITEGAQVGSGLASNDLLDLGSRSAIDKALQRLALAKDIRRIDQGI